MRLTDQQKERAQIAWEEEDVSGLDIEEMPSKEYRQKAPWVTSKYEEFEEDRK